MAQTTVAINCEPATKAKHSVCPAGQHVLEKATDGEYVCKICSVVPKEQPEDDYHSNALAKAASSKDHMPEDKLLIIPMGMQHDMTSQSNKGLAMELGIGSNVRDFEGKKARPQLQFGYVTGQVVGKGSQVYEIENFDLILACTDRTKRHHEALAQLTNPRVNGIKTMECPICKKESEIIDVHRYLVPRARKSFIDDTIYRDAKIAANNISTHLQLDAISRSQYGRQVEKAFGEWVALSKQVLPMLALLRMEKRVSGVGLSVPKELLDGYPEILEKVRVMLVEPLIPQSER